MVDEKYKRPQGLYNHKDVTIVPMLQLLTCVWFVGFLGISASGFGSPTSFWPCFVCWQVHFGFASFVECVPLSSALISDGCFPLFSPRSHHSRIFHSPLFSIFWFVNANVDDSNGLPKLGKNYSYIIIARLLLYGYRDVPVDERVTMTNFSFFFLLLRSLEFLQ